MKIKVFLASAAVASLALAGAAFAQTSTPASTTQPATVASAPAKTPAKVGGGRQIHSGKHHKRMAKRHHVRRAASKAKAEAPAKPAN